MDSGRIAEALVSGNFWYQSFVTILLNRQKGMYLYPQAGRNKTVIANY